MALGPTQPPIQWVPEALSLGVKRPEREADHSHPSSAEVKEWVELYPHSPSTLSWRAAQLKHRDNFILTLWTWWRTLVSFMLTGCMLGHQNPLWSEVCSDAWWLFRPRSLTWPELLVFIVKCFLSWECHMFTLRGGTCETRAYSGRCHHWEATCPRELSFSSLLHPLIPF
jgi:hypothetical protein